jgi:hypothetical protein
MGAEQQAQATRQLPDAGQSLWGDNAFLPMDGADGEEVHERFARAGIDINAMAVPLHEEAAMSFVEF